MPYVTVGDIGGMHRRQRRGRYRCDDRIAGEVRAAGEPHAGGPPTSRGDRDDGRVAAHPAAASCSRSTSAAVG
jgi:hypothetical protein